MAFQKIILIQVTIIFILVCVGYLSSRKGIIDEKIATGLTDILLNISLPALVISSCIRSFDVEVLQNVIIIFFATLVIHLILLVGSKIFFIKYSKPRRNVLTYCAMFPNVGFMGMPFVLSLYGQSAIIYAAAFMIAFQMFIWTYGVLLFHNKGSLLQSIISILKMPLFLSVVVGLLIFALSIPVPAVLDSSLSILGAMTTPLAMIIIGHQMTRMKLSELIDDKDVYYGSFIRLVIAPLLTWLVMRSFGMDPFIINICVLLQALPTAITISLMPQKYGGETVFATKCLAVTHGFSFFSIPAMLMLLTV
jgi:malate permease and related proteins